MFIKIIPQLTFSHLPEYRLHEKRCRSQRRIRNQQLHESLRLGVIRDERLPLLLRVILRIEILSRLGYHLTQRAVIQPQHQHPDEDLREGHILGEVHEDMLKVVNEEEEVQVLEDHLVAEVSEVKKEAEVTGRCWPQP